MDILTKRCYYCKLDLEISNYHKCSSKKDGLQSMCKDCKKELARKRYNKDKEYFVNKQREYRKKNKESLDLNRKNYREKNKEALLKKQREYEKERYHSDSKYRLTKNIRSRTLSAFKALGVKKETKTMSMLGCTIDELKDHIESLFTDGMNWENQGQWHIDHIIPISSAKNNEDLMKLSHYTNLQPMWEIENKRKSNKILIKQ